MDRPFACSQLNESKGNVELTSPVESETLKFQLEGVHFIQDGIFFAFAEPKGFAHHPRRQTDLLKYSRSHIDIRQLPSLTPERLRNITSVAVEAELDRRVKKLTRLVEAGSLDLDEPGLYLAIICLEEEPLEQILRRAHGPKLYFSLLCTTSPNHNIPEAYADPRARNEIAYWCPHPISTRHTTRCRVAQQGLWPANRS
jgi:hypothetical protein